jgi:hypothetical protein
MTICIFGYDHVPFIYFRRVAIYMQARGLVLDSHSGHKPTRVLYEPFDT